MGLGMFTESNFPPENGKRCHAIFFLAKGKQLCYVGTKANDTYNSN